MRYDLIWISKFRLACFILDDGSPSDSALSHKLQSPSIPSLLIMMVRSAVECRNYSSHDSMSLAVSLSLLAIPAS